MFTYCHCLKKPSVSKNFVWRVIGSRYLYTVSHLQGKELRYKNKLLQLFSPSLHWLNTGDRIGFIRPQDGPVKVFINGEELPLCIPSLPECLYVVIDLRGSCASINVISHKASLSPLNSMRLQDSLELLIDQEPVCLLENKEVSLQDQSSSSNSNFIYEFHENHGRNIELFNRKTSARRVASYNQGIVLVYPPLECNAMAQVIVEHLELQWQSSLIVGLVASVPDRLNLPVNALSIKGPCCIVANDWISINGIKSRSSYGQSLNSVTVGDSIVVMLTDNRQFKLIINNVELDPIVWMYPVGHPVYAVFDLYGQCQQIRIVNSVDISGKTPTGVECEKADLESCEKERSDPKLTLPIPSASTSSHLPMLPKNTPTTPYNPLNCSYREECEKFKRKLLLPDHFFTSDFPICYCTHCYRAKSQPEEKDNPMHGWVKFPLCNMANVANEKWHNAFYPMKMGAIRCILDKGQLLTKGQMQYCNLVNHKDDDLQVVFHHSLVNCFNMGFKYEDKEAHAAFQILVKPGAYSVSRDPHEWSTKETGAISLQGLLIHVRPL